MLEMKDLETAASAVANFVALLRGRLHLHRIQKLFVGQRRSQARTVEDRVSPSGKRVQVVAFRDLYDSRPSRAQLWIQKPRTTDLPPLKGSILIRTPDGRVHLDRDKSHRLRQEQGFYFNLLLPGERSPSAPEIRTKAFPVCPKCQSAFHPPHSGQKVCCKACEKKKRPTRLQHADDCSRIDINWRADPNLRVILTDVGQAKASSLLQGMNGTEEAVTESQLEQMTERLVGIPVQPWQHLVACDESEPMILLQLAVYAQRAGWFTPNEAEENRLYLCFKKEFEGILPSLKRADILAQLWKPITNYYRLPPEADGFSHYVRTLIRVTKAEDLLREHPCVDVKKPLAEITSPLEAARRVGVHWRHFYKLIHEGVIRAKKIGRTIKLFPTWPEDFELWKTEKEKKSRLASQHKAAEFMLTQHRNIKPESGKKQLQRWRKKGLDSRTITQKVLQAGPMERARTKEVQCLRGQLTLSNDSPVDYEYNTIEDDLQIVLDQDLESNDEARTAENGDAINARDARFHADNGDVEAIASGYIRDINDRCTVFHSSAGDPIKIELLKVSRGINLNDLPRHLKKVVEQVVRKLNLPLSGEAT
jgi:excisionase family DNA binding protein